MFRPIKLVGTVAFAVLLASSGVAFAKTAASTATSVAAPKAAHSAKMAAKSHGKAVPAIKKTQEALNKHGAQLKLDGKMGPATRTALKNFQAEHGLKKTGRLDKATRAKLLA